MKNKFRNWHPLSDFSIRRELLTASFLFIERIFCKASSFQKNVRCEILLFLMLLGLFIPVTHSADLMSTNFSFAMASDGRNIDRIQAYEDRWLFTECSRELAAEEECYVLMFDSIKKKLYRYMVPSGYVYSYASFSPSGRFILMSRRLRSLTLNDLNMPGADSSEIVLMNTDGTNFQVLPISRGRNLAPAMSKDETKIVYWRAGARRDPNAKSSLADLDIYEYDLRLKKDSYFSFDADFFEGGNLQYISDREVLVGAWGPRRFVRTMGISVYDKKFRASQIYKFERDAREFPSPLLFHNVENARSPSLDRDRNIYFEGTMPKIGLSFVKVTKEGAMHWWVEPRNLALSNFRHISVSPDGKYFLFLYVPQGRSYRDQKSAVGILDIETGVWSPVSLPSLRTSIEILVTNKN